MGCELNPRIPYTEFSVIIKKQKEVRGSAQVPFQTCLGWIGVNFTGFVCLGILMYSQFTVSPLSPF
jgi:hypothetical protein